MLAAQSVDFGTQRRQLGFGVFSGGSFGVQLRLCSLRMLLCGLGQFSFGGKNLAACRLSQSKPVIADAQLEPEYLAVHVVSQHRNPDAIDLSPPSQLRFDVVTMRIKYEILVDAEL